MGKQFYKKWWFWVIALITLGAIGSGQVPFGVIILVAIVYFIAKKIRGLQKTYTDVNVVPNKP